MNFFGKAPSTKDQLRDNERQLRRTQKTIERDRLQLERDEKKLEAEIKKLAKEGNKEGCVILAKQLVNLRKQKTRSVAASSKIQGIAMQSKVIGANAALSSAISTSSKTMGSMNALMQPQKINADMKAFQTANMKMQMTEEMINDSLDDILDGSDDEEECDAVIDQVLDDITLEIRGKMSKAPSAERGKVDTLADSEIAERMAKLRVPE